ncbi:MAG: diguanylate cyclase domain protein [Rhizobium sp.]|nr:diguanylate cyclase domain protein [Rhizobium sp.]
MKPPRITRSNLLLLRFPAALALFATLMLISDQSITSIEDGIRLHLFNVDRFEEATRAEMDVNDLIGKAYRYAHGDSSVRDADVQLAFDIFYSRIDALNASSYHEALKAADVVETAIIVDVAKALPELEKAIQMLHFGVLETFAGVGAFAIRYQDGLMHYSDKAYSARRNRMQGTVEKALNSLKSIKVLQLEYGVLAGLTFLYVLFELYLSRRGNRKLNATVEEKHHLLISDHLTGICNRRHFETALHCRSRDADFAVVLIDLDSFKGVNDTLGHAAGDQLLRYTALVLSELSVEGDVASRLGGDEFAVLVEGSKARAEEFARRAVERINEGVLFEGQPIKASASIGVAHSGEAGKEATGVSLMKNADIALYAAKAAGRNRVQFTTPEIMIESNRKRRLQKELRTAIADGQIHVDYQPIVSLKCGTPKGIEALVRWTHPEFGAISPFEIIDAAEQTNQILPLTLHVADRACEVRNWMSKCGYDLLVTVNVTPGLLNLPGFSEAVLEVAKSHGIERGQLLLELTEDAMMAENEIVDRNIEHFRLAGIYLAVDDFGKGYSNLSRLANLEFRKIKLDKSLIDHVATSGKSLNIARSISRMAYDLGINVIAEGVETAEQKAVLQELGIALAQGYFYARPMNSLSLLSYLRKDGERDLSPLRVAG